MPPKPFAPVCKVTTCKHYKSVDFRPRCALGINNRHGRNYTGPCPSYEPKENAKSLPEWYKDKKSR